MKYVATTAKEVFDLLRGEVTVAGAPIKMAASTMVIYGDGSLAIRGNDMSGIDPQVQLKDILTHMAGLLGIANIEFAPPPGALHRGYGPLDPFTPGSPRPYYHPKDRPWPLTLPDITCGVPGPLNEKSPPNPAAAPPANRARSGFEQ